MGRPPFQWTDEMASEILSRLANGETMTEICGPDRDDWLPSERTVYKRIAEDAEFAQHYARAREAQAHFEADEIKAIADNATPENVQVARLRVDARKWRAAKMAPKVYGDKIDLDVKGSFNVNLDGDDAKL